MNGIIGVCLKLQVVTCSLAMNKYGYGYLLVAILARQLWTSTMLVVAYFNKLRS